MKGYEGLIHIAGWNDYYLSHTLQSDSITNSQVITLGKTNDSATACHKDRDLPNTFHAMQTPVSLT